MTWRIVGGPHEYEGTSMGGEIAVGWTWDLERDGESRSITAEISDADHEGRVSFEDAENAVLDVLDEGDPPQRLVVSGDGGVSRG